MYVKIIIKSLNTYINYYLFEKSPIINASAESFNAKIKAFRTQFRGVGDIKFFMYRLATLYSWLMTVPTGNIR